MHKERHTQLNSALGKILRVLQKEVQPQKVILFGSMASGDVDEWSDLDLVIIKETQQPFIKRSEEIALLCLAPVGVDYLVYTPAEFEQMVADKNPFVLEEIIKKGKILYEREPATAMAG
jgi:predicted nucleotidyltransferase